MSELERTISSRELSEWEAFYADEPWGDVRGDIRAAHQMALLANVNRDRKKRKSPYKPKDFLLLYGPEGEMRGASTPDQILRFVEMMNSLMGGKDLRPRTPDGGGA